MPTNWFPMDAPRSPEELFFEAAQRFADLDQREAFLDAACGKDAALRRRLDELFAAQKQAEGFFNAGVNALMPTANIELPPGADSTSVGALITEGPGTVIGRY